MVKNFSHQARALVITLMTSRFGHEVNCLKVRRSKVAGKAAAASAERE
jgi:hypothetical protein